MRVAELCAGFGGLFLGMQTAGLPVELAWYAENDPDASIVMAAHHDAPNHGDITTADWAAVEQVDILAAGFPCQPMSCAGKRRGSADERHLWPTGVLPAVAALMPPVLLFENVPGLLTIEHGEVFRTILQDLDRLGYTIRWSTIGACKVGLCHHRHRVFILATREVGELPPELGMPISAWSRGRSRNPWPRDGVCTGGEVWAEPTDHCHVTGLLLPTPTAHIADRGTPGAELAAARMESGRRNLDDAIALLPTPRASDSVKGGPNQRGSSGGLALPAAVQPERWGQYAEAVWRQELVTGMRAPDPTVVGKRGGRRINPALTEWMQALPEGWITGPVEDPNAANKIAGNGVAVPAVAAAIQRMVRRSQLTLTPTEVPA